MLIQTINHRFTRIPRTRARTTHIIIHHSAGGDVPAASIHQWHLQRNWVGIGYHYVIRQNGNVETGRPHNTIGSHAGRINNVSIGICLTGNFEKHHPTEAQYESLKNLIDHIKILYPRVNFIIQGHRDVMATLCPGRNFDFNKIL